MASIFYFFFLWLTCAYDLPNPTHEQNDDVLSNLLSQFHKKIMRYLQESRLIKKNSVTIGVLLVLAVI